MGEKFYSEKIKDIELKTKRGPVMARVFLDCFLEDIPLEGNVMASGDDMADKKAENEILERLESGDYWAWFTAFVRVEAPGVLPGTDSLGACSYNSVGQFLEDDYFNDMVLMASEDLEKNIEALYSAMGRVRE